MSSFWHSFVVGCHSNYVLKLSFWLNLKNSDVLRQRVVEKDLPHVDGVTCVFVDPRYIIDVLQIEAAVTQALIHSSNQSSGEMITRELSTEILYCLSSCRSIKQAFETFGIHSTTKSLIVIILCSSDHKILTANKLADYLSTISNLIDGDAYLKDHNSFWETDFEEVCSYYEINKAERKFIEKSEDSHKVLVESILSRMAARDLLRK